MPTPPLSEQDTRFYDAGRLVAHGRALHELATAPAATTRQHAGTPLMPGARLGLLAGSFNPPTLAHQTLAAAGLDAGGLGTVWYALSTRTVDKEVVSGACLEDRLLMLDLLTADDHRQGVLLVNRGLYVDQARLVRAAFPAVGEIVFLVGFDKIVQIFDPRYYEDRDAALTHLFALVTFLVAPRGTDEAPALAALLAQPENRPFAAAVLPLSLPQQLRAVASSSIRGSFNRGNRADGTLDADTHEEADTHASMPPAVAQFVAATGVYADDTRYRRRCDIIAEAVQAAPSSPAELARYGERLRAV